MIFLDYVIYELNSHRNFSSIITKSLSDKNHTAPASRAIHLIIHKILDALYIQFVINKKELEISRIAQDCSAINFDVNNHVGHDTIILKGNGIISELFGIKLIDAVEEIAFKTGIEKNIAKYLISAIAPIAMKTLNKIHLQKHFSSKEMSIFLLEETKISHQKNAIKTNGSLRLFQGIKWLLKIVQ